MRLNLQQAPAVRLFFEGGWLEWYAFIELLTLVQGRGRGFSCPRGVQVAFPNGDPHGLGGVFLPLFPVLGGPINSFRSNTLLCTLKVPASVLSFSHHCR